MSSFLGRTGFPNSPIFVFKIKGSRVQMSSFLARTGLLSCLFLSLKRKEVEFIRRLFLLELDYQLAYCRCFHHLGPNCRWFEVKHIFPVSDR